MSIPAAITPITVSGQYIHPDGTPAAGLVRFIPSITATASGAIVPVTPLAVELDDTGAFSVQLAATDDPQWAAAGWTYTVIEQVRGARDRSYSIEVPAAGGPLDLATVVPVQPVVDVSPYFLARGFWLNARTAGAAGDGITDDTAAIQAAIDVLPAAGGTIYFPAGDYKITAPITARSDLVLQGDGQDKTYLRQVTTTADCIAGVDISYLALRDLQLFGPGSGTGVGLNLTRSVSPNTAKISLSDVVIYNFGSHGLSISNPIVTTLHNVSSIANGGHGFDVHGVDGGAAGTSVTFTGCYGNANKQAGYNLRKMTYCALIGCAADHNGIGYLIDTSEGVTLAGCGCESPVNQSGGYPGVGFKITGSVSVGLLNTWLLGNIGTGWWVTGSSTAVTLLAPRESGPISATAAVKVDAASKATVIDPSAATANSLATGTSSVLSAGSLSLPGSVTLADDGVLSRPSPFALRAENNFQVGSSFAHQGANAGFYGAAPAPRPTVVGSRGGNAALGSLIGGLAALGLLVDSTTA